MVECVPLSTTKFNWAAKIKSIQEVEVGRKWVGSDMSWWKPSKDVSVKWTKSLKFWTLKYF